MSDLHTHRTKFDHRRLSPAEFRALLKRSRLSLRDFLYLTGRRREQIESYIEDDTRSFIPTMGDVLILELAALDSANVDDMMEIVDGYWLEPSQKET
jgi:hypothetical protein